MARNISVVNLVRTELASHIADTEGEIVDRAVMQYMSGKLNPEQAFAILGEISGLRRLMLAMDREATKEAAAYQRSFEHGANPEEEPE